MLLIGLISASPHLIEKQANPNDYTAEELTNQVHQADMLFDKGL